jgi:hypothetical protein
MTSLRTLLGTAILLLVLTHASDAQVMVNRGFNPWTGMPYRSVVARNPWTGHIVHGGRTVDPWTGRTVRGARGEPLDRA